jgi:hypothetical protein
MSAQGANSHLLEVFSSELDVPTVATVCAAVGDDISGLEALVGWERDGMAEPAAVDADDRRECRMVLGHGVDRSPSTARLARCE